MTCLDSGVSGLDVNEVFSDALCYRGALGQGEGEEGMMTAKLQGPDIKESST